VIILASCLREINIQFFETPHKMTDTLKSDLKAMLVEVLMLEVTAEEIGDDAPLFGPDSIGLDSVDALQIVVSLDKKFGLKISDQTEAKKILTSVSTMAEAVARVAGNRRSG
jgi:acyl carrier protein